MNERDMLCNRRRGTPSALDVYAGRGWFYWFKQRVAGRIDDHSTLRDIDIRGRRRDGRNGTDADDGIRRREHRTARAGFVGVAEAFLCWMEQWRKHIRGRIGRDKRDPPEWWKLGCSDGGMGSECAVRADRHSTGDV